jgi:hypothetical protein
MFSVVPLTLDSWIVCFLISFSILPVDYVRKVIMKVIKK